jgi:hypothetical protein
MVFGGRGSGVVAVDVGDLRSLRLTAVDRL